MPAKFSSDQIRTIATLSTAIAIRMLGIFLVLPIFTLYGEQFTSSKPLIGLAFGSYGLTNALLQIPFGWLSDRFGRKRLLLIGLTLHSVGSILCAVPLNIFFLIIARLIQGAGAIGSVAFALVADSVEEKNRATAMAFLGVAIGLSIVGGFLAGSPIASIAGYASLFWISGVLSLLAAVYLALVVEEPARVRPDTEGAARRPTVASVFKIGDVFRLDVCGFLTYFFMTSFFFFFPLLARGYMPLERYPLLLVPGLLAGTVTMFAASRAADRGYARVAGVAAFVMLSISGLLLFRGADFGFQAHPLLALTVAGVFLFSGFSSLQPILPSLITKASPQTVYGAALGTYSSLQFLGSFAGGAAAGILAPRGDQFVMAGLLVAAALGVMLMAQVQAG